MQMMIAEMIIEQCEKSKQGKDWILEKTGNRSLKPEIWVRELGPHKREFLEELENLGEHGEKLLQIKWQERGNQPSEIHFRLQDLSRFYQLAGKQPKEEKVRNYAAFLKNQIKQTSSEWICNYDRYLLQAVEQGNLTEIEKCHKHLWDTLTAIDHLTEPVYKRAFSKKVLNHSKMFENELQNKIVSIAKKFHPELQDVDEMMDSDDSQKNKKWGISEVLSQLYIEDYSQELTIKGALKISVEDPSSNEIHEIDLSRFPYGVVLNSETLKHATPSKEQNIRKIITVENKANYVAMPCEEEVLIIFCHGFFTPKEREFLRMLQARLNDKKVEYFHTGDLDFGGIRIFIYNRNHIFPNLKPLHMDVETYHKYLKYGEVIEDKKIKKLGALKDKQMQPLIDEMLQEKMAIEQEIFLSVESVKT